MPFLADRSFLQGSDTSPIGSKKAEQPLECTVDLTW